MAQACLRYNYKNCSTLTRYSQQAIIVFKIEHFSCKMSDNLVIYTYRFLKNEMQLYINHKK